MGGILRALITGGTGFVAQHLVAALLVEGWEVVACSRKPSTVRANACRTIEVDVIDGPSISRVLDAEQFDVIFHLAGVTGSSPITDLFTVNVVGTAVLLDAVRALARPELKLVLLGSSAQYGACESDPISEEATASPITNYGVSKACAEMAALALFRRNGQHVIAARAFNIIGPGQGESLLQGAVTKQIVRAEQVGGPRAIEVGALSAYRDFVDVRDVATGLIALAKRGRPGEVYNVCSGQARQVRSLVQGLSELASVPMTIDETARDGSEFDLPYQRGSFEKLRMLAGWEPAFPFERSLRDALDSRRGSSDRLGARLVIEPESQ